MSLTASELVSAKARLSEFNFILLLDASGSMGEPTSADKSSPLNKVSRWDSMQETVIAFARDVNEIDTDGLGVIVFGNDNITAEDNCDVDKVRNALSTRTPRGNTPTTEGITAAIKMAGTSDKNAFVLCFTDGAASNHSSLIKAIVDQANSQATVEKFKILFVQVGDDKGASQFLKQLDDDLGGAGAKLDIVACLTIDEANKFPTTTEMVLAELNA